MKKLNLQLFAAGENNGLSARVYTKEFAELVASIYATEALFVEVFGAFETKDGIAHNATAFSLKTSDIPVTVGTYSKNANVGMGTGTGSTSRFGNRTEIIYTDVDVEYSADWAIHEGIDRHTVNADLEGAVADRLELQAKAKVNAFNVEQAAYLVDGATALTTGTIDALLNEANKKYIQLGVNPSLAKVAYLSADAYQAIVDGTGAVSSKGSSVNIDVNGVARYKGFILKPVADAILGSGVDLITCVAGSGKAFMGIETARTIESEDFDGVALQGAGKNGQFIPKDNFKAVFKGAMTPIA